MITKIELENFRCYEKHAISFSELSIIVGKNNAGKSTLIEALRLVSLVSSRYKSLTYKKAPEWSNLPCRYFGVSPSLKGIDISFDGIFYKYGKQPAKISAFFQNNSRIEVYVGEGKDIFASLFNEKGKMIVNKAQAREFDLLSINILPQIGPLNSEEKNLDEEYVKSNIYSSLSSIHFRNQLKYFAEYFSRFKKLAEESWENLQIGKLDKGDLLYEISPTLMINDDGFVTEVGRVGHGLQMWLQTMWFLSRCDKKSTIILDEPDVYLHADMQRKLISILKNRYRQIIIATHSIEIISEVEPDNILVVNKKNAVSKFLTSLPAMQKIIDSLGSMQNIELIRYWMLRRVLFVEGEKDDIKILKFIQQRIASESNIAIDNIPRAVTEGWSGWSRVVGANSVLKKSGIKVCCIFDSDYHIEEAVKKRISDAHDNGIKIHIWAKKEIENYLIIPETISRVLAKNGNDRTVTLDIIRRKINSLADNMKNDVIDSYSEEIRVNEKGLSVASSNKKARYLVNSFWSSKKLDKVSGKKLLSTLSKWSEKKFGVSLSKFEIAKNLKENEIDGEIKSMLTNFTI